MPNSKVFLQVEVALPLARNAGLHWLVSLTNEALEICKTELAPVEATLGLERILEVISRIAELDLSDTALSKETLDSKS